MSNTDPSSLLFAPFPLFLFTAYLPFLALIAFQLPTLCPLAAAVRTLPAALCSLLSAR